MSHHVVDGGYSDDGPRLVDHINTHYGSPARIDNVVLTHPDQDHAAGLATILESYDIGALWMNRPWRHVNALLPMFEYPYTAETLTQRLKRDFPYTAKLERIAEQRGIEIFDAFQGQNIGQFLVMSPTYQHYLDMVVASEKTPESERQASILGQVYQVVRSAVQYVGVLWGAENLKGDTEGTSAENEMSIVQLAIFEGEKILLTGDAGVKALEIAHAYAVSLGVQLPGVDHFQIPHHGARRNLSTPILDKWLGPRLPAMPTPEQMTFNTVVSAHEDDEDHPRKAVVRAMWHRGGRVSSTEDGPFIYMKGRRQLFRPGTRPAQQKGYPQDMED